jgi:hypothetical protein
MRSRLVSRRRAPGSPQRSAPGGPNHCRTPRRVPRRWAAPAVPLLGTCIRASRPAVRGYPHGDNPSASRIRLHSQTYRCGSAKKEEIPGTRSPISIAGAARSLHPAAKTTRPGYGTHSTPPMLNPERWARRPIGRDHGALISNRSSAVTHGASMWMYSIDCRTLLVTSALVNRSPTVFAIVIVESDPCRHRCWEARSRARGVS